MPPGGLGGDPPPRGAREQPGPHEEGFADLLDGVRLLAHGHREGGHADRSPAEAHDQCLQHGPVQPVQPEDVDVVEIEREGEWAAIIARLRGAAT